MSETEQTPAMPSAVPTPEVKKPRKRRVTKAKKKVSKLTLDELRSYIKGATELNAEGWHPNKDQWDTIVSMIENVVENPTQRVSANPLPMQHTAPMHRQPEAVPSAMGEGESFERRDAGGRFDGSINAEARPVAVQAQGSIAGHKDDDNVVSSGIQIKTPNVDNSEGPYESGFK